MITLEKEKINKDVAMAVIKVIGVGGAGGNTLNSIIETGCEDIETIAANTDAQALAISKADITLQLGVKSTKGLGTGANPEVGRRAAEEDLEKMMQIVGDADIVFLTAGLGGGTGSGALPIISQAIRERGILCISVVTKPFLFEGKRRSSIAENALEQLKRSVDTLIVVPNQKLLEVAEQGISVIDAFAMTNDILAQSVKGISDIITKSGHINVDFADVKTIMQGRGLAVMGSAKASGTGRAKEAALRAISSPLLENMSIRGAQGVLINITGGSSLGLHEVNEAVSVVYEQAHEDAHIILGSVIDESIDNDDVLVTIIATGFERSSSSSDGGFDSIDPLAMPHSTPKKSAPVLHTRPAQATDDKELLQQSPEAKEEISRHSASCATADDDLVMNADMLDVPTFLRKHE